MYLYSNITGLCQKQIYFSSGKPGLFHAGSWCMATPPEWWISPQELFLQEQKAALESTENLEPKAGASHIFRLLVPTWLTSGGEKISSPCRVATRGWSVCLLTETTSCQWWALLQTDCSREHINSSARIKTYFFSISQQLLCFETHYNSIKKEGCLLNGLVIPLVRRTSW